MSLLLLLPWHFWCPFQVSAQFILFPFLATFKKWAENCNNDIMTIFTKMTGAVFSKFWDDMFLYILIKVDFSRQNKVAKIFLVLKEASKLRLLKMSKEAHSRIWQIENEILKCHPHHHHIAQCTEGEYTGTQMKVANWKIIEKTFWRKLKSNSFLKWRNLSYYIWHHNFNMACCKISENMYLRNV